MIGIDFKTGVFRISKTACEYIGLRKGNQIEFAYDESEKQWYVTKVETNGFELREGTASSGLLFNNIAMSEKIKITTDFIERSGKCLVGSEPITYSDKRKFFPVITASLKNN